MGLRTAGSSPQWKAFERRRRGENPEPEDIRSIIVRLSLSDCEALQKMAEEHRMNACDLAAFFLHHQVRDDDA